MRTIGVLTTDIRSLYFAHVAYTVERQLSGVGYNVLLSNTGDQPEEKRRSLQVMLEKQIDGLILVGSVFKEETDNRHIVTANRSVPVVMINACLEEEHIPAVICDDMNGIRQAVDYLAAEGHREIAFFKDVDSFSCRAKLAGFLNGMHQHGLDETHLFEVDCSIKGGKDGVNRLLQEAKSVTAIIAGEDSVAVGALKALHERGFIVPNDLSVVGYNNTVLAEGSSPSLTSVNNKAQEMAERAVELLWGVLQGRQVPIQTKINPTLIVRESTGPCVRH
jgi:LacI family transcriptional regulator